MGTQAGKSVIGQQPLFVEEGIPSILKCSSRTKVLSYLLENNKKRTENKTNIIS